MEIKNYDDMIVVECNKDKFGHLFTPLLLKGSKWIDISGKNFFATTIDNYSQLKLIVDNISRSDIVVDKYNSNIELKLKEEYYKSFDCRPLHFSAELRRNRRSKTSAKSLSSSVYDDDDTSSSDGFPSPGTPGRKKRDDDDDDSQSDLDYIINKINELEERIEKLEDTTSSTPVSGL
jgi:hypothetical protein